MALVVKNTKSLITGDNVRVKILIYGLPGLGKTSFYRDAPNAGVAACETGEGNGLLSIASSGLDYVEPSNYSEFEQFCNGIIFKDKETVVLDSLTSVGYGFIKEAAIAIPRNGAASAKRVMGIPELDDYGVMGELLRKNIRKLLDLDKHVVVTATEKHKEPGPESPTGVGYVCPELPGSMSLGCTAMFDYVFRLRHRNVLIDPNDAKKGRRTERYWVVEPDAQGSVVKARCNEGGARILPKEIIYDLQTGKGTFADILKTIKNGYTQAI